MAEWLDGPPKSVSWEQHTQTMNLARELQKKLSEGTRHAVNEAMEEVRPYHLPQCDEYIELLDSLRYALYRMSDFFIDDEWWTLYGVYKRHCEALGKNPGTYQDGKEMERRMELYREGRLPPDEDDPWGLGTI